MPSIEPIEVHIRNEVRTQIPTRTYATHGVDRYPAKMVPHLARFAIERVSKAGDLILDPFCGCGTVQIECRMTGRIALGFDINPVAVFLARGKSAICAAETLQRHCDAIINGAETMLNVELDTAPWVDYWFTPVTLKKLCAIRRSLANQRRRMGQNYYDALRACLIICVRLCSRADPRSPKPFISKRAREKRCGKHFDPFHEFRRVVKRFANAAPSFREKVRERPTTCTARVADARALSSQLSANSIDAVVTSPPYLTAQDYFRSSKLELAILGRWKEESPCQLGQKIIGSGRGRIACVETECDQPSEILKLREFDTRAALVATAYRGDMSTVLRELHTVMKPRAKCVVVVGDCTIRGIELSVHKWFVELSERQGFVLTEHLIDTIRDRRVPPNRLGHNGLIRQEHLLFFEKLGA